MNHVNVECHLVIGQGFSQYGAQRGRPTVRVSKRKPAVQQHEVAIAIKLRLPESLFLRPSLSATIHIPDAEAPGAIQADIMENIAQVVKDQLGIVLTVNAPEADHD